MRRKTPAHHTHTYGFAIFIGALVVLLIISTLAIKLLLLFQKSEFDGKQQFILEEKEPSATRFFIFNPQDQSLHTLFVNSFFSVNPLYAYGIPIDATITSDSDITSYSDLANALILHRKSLHASTTIIDGINLFIFIHTLDSSKTLAKNVSLTNLSQEGVTDPIFTDSALYKEGKSIAIVNGSAITGLGNKIAMLLTRLGANVVSVTTADTPSATSLLQYTGGTSYTLTRIAHILKLTPVHLSTATIFDITILLGEDRIRSMQ